jgi:hypothetical protein
MSRRAPSYAPSTTIGSRSALQSPDETHFSRFIREEIMAPEKLPGNVNILASLTLFFGSIVAIRMWGDLLIPI